MYGGSSPGYISKRSCIKINIFLQKSSSQNVKINKKNTVEKKD